MTHENTSTFTTANAKAKLVGHLARLIRRYRLDYAAFKAICKAARNLEWPGVKQRLLR